MFAVTACVLICKEVTSASATTASRRLRTRPCAWVRGALAPEGGGSGTSRRDYSLVTCQINMPLSETILQKVNYVELFIVSFSIKSGSKDISQYVPRFSVRNPFPQMTFTWAVGHSGLCVSHCSTSCPVPPSVTTEESLFDYNNARA